MRARWLVGVLAMAAVLGATIPTGAAVFRNGRISFMRFDYDAQRSGAYTVRPDGTDARPILADGKSTYNAAFSPNGQRIAVQVRSEGRFLLQIIDLRGNVRRTLGTFRDLLPSVSWSPRGSKLAICGFIGSFRRASVWIVRRDGSGARKIADRACGPNWSPDGD